MGECCKRLACGAKNSTELPSVSLQASAVGSTKGKEAVVISEERVPAV